jgi:4-amino-4-deoxy-L-arabinose transferase-like glycosyltransferase
VETLDADALAAGEELDARGADQPPEAPGRWSSERAWWLWLGGLTLLGLIVRLGSVLGRLHRLPGGDGAYYYNAARLLIEGKGWINPFVYAEPGHHLVQTAAWPPLFVLVMAVPQVLGLHSFEAARLWLCLFGSGAVVLSAYAGREISGKKLGLIAAGLVAIYPNIWMSIDLGLSETMTPLLVAWVIWMAYRFWHRPGLRRAIWFALSLGVTMLGRDELALLVLFIFVPLVLLARQLSLKERFKILVVGALIVILVVGPWVGYNMSRFSKPTFISTGLGITLASANCDQTWSGTGAGYWSFLCARATPVNPKGDESAQGADAQRYALHYIRTHLRELPQVELDRAGRAFGLFRPIQQIQLDSAVETRPYNWALVGLGMYYVLFLSALGGTWVLRRRKIPTFPLWAIGLNVLVSVLITFGNTRYRTPFEVPLVLLASALYAEGAAWLLARRHDGALAAPAC